MKLYTSLSQLTQPPHFGRVNAQPVHAPKSGDGYAATRVVRQSNYERVIKTQKHGLRAVVGA